MRYRGRHRARTQHRRTRRLTSIAALTTTTLLAPLALGGPGASHATVGAPAVPPIRVQTVDPEETVNRVYGAIDSVRESVDHTVDLAALQDEIEKQYPKIGGEDPVNVVVGTVQNAQGIAMAGVTIVLELLPSEGYDPLGDGSIVWELARTVTDESGQFIALVPTTDQVLAEAEYLNGTVNMMITALKYEATQRGLWNVYLGAGAIYSSMVEYGPGVGGVAMAPVNVGVMTVEEAKVLGGASGLTEVSPGNDPDDPSTVTVDRPNVAPGAVGDVATTVPAVSEPHVETPLSLSTSYVALPPDFPDMPADFAKDDNDTDGGDSRCKRPANQGRWIVDRLDAGYEWQPVGEVHSVPGTKVKYVYSERANTQLGVGIKEDGKNWKLSGAISVTNDSGANVSLPYQPDSFARRVQGEFVYHHNRKTWCPDGYDDVDGPYALHMEEIVGKTWAGGVRFDSRDISGRDNGNEYEKAKEELRSATLYKGASFTKTKGKTYKYTFDVSAFGVGLNAESVNDVKHTMVLVAGSTRESWHMFGDIDLPTEPANHAIYVYY